MKPLLFALLVAGCRADPLPPKRTTDLASAGSPSTVDTTDPVDSGTPIPADCSADGTFAVYTYDIETEEDFDFDALGNLVHQGIFGVVAETIDGGRQTISQFFLSDPAGIRLLPDGNLASAQPDTGSVKWINYDTGASTLLASGLDNPNGLVIARDGTVFISELTTQARVHELAPDGTATVVLSGADFPNNMALSLDERTLYIAMFNDGQIALVDRTDEGWSEPRLFYDVGASVEAIAVDACGHVWVAPFGGGHLMRISPDGADVEDLGPLPASFVASMRFGSGIGGWQRDGLYLTNRSQIFGIHTGIDGAALVWE